MNTKSVTRQPVRPFQIEKEIIRATEKNKWAVSSSTLRCKIVSCKYRNEVLKWSFGMRAACERAWIPLVPSIVSCSATFNECTLRKRTRPGPGERWLNARSRPPHALNMTRRKKNIVRCPNERGRRATKPHAGVFTSEPRPKERESLYAVHDVKVGPACTRRAGSEHRASPRTALSFVCLGSRSSLAGGSVPRAESDRRDAQVCLLGANKTTRSTLNCILSLAPRRPSRRAVAS